MQMLTNFEIKDLPRYEKAVKIANIYEGKRFHINEKAFDISGVLIPNYNSLWITTQGDCSRFWEVYDEC